MSKTKTIEAQIKAVKAEIAFWKNRVDCPVDNCAAGIRLDNAALNMNKGKLQRLQALKCQAQSRVEVAKLFG